MAELDPMRGITIYSGSAHVELAEEIARTLGMALSPVDIQRFSNDCIQPQLLTSCREADVFFVQPVSPPTQENLMELLLMIAAARSSAASRITAVIPHYAYARSDKKDAPRIPIGGKLVADLLQTAGADRVITVALHSAQVHGFFNIPVDHLNALNILAKYFRERGGLENAIVVSPDLGNAKNAAKFARLLDVSVAAGNKRRVSDNKVIIDMIVGDVSGKDVIIMDDEIATGGSILEIVDKCQEAGARRVAVACTHGLFTGKAIERLGARKDIDEIITTNTVPVPESKRLPNMKVLSIAPLLAEAIRRTHNGESITSIFDEEK